MLYSVIFFIPVLLFISAWLIRIKASFEYVRNKEDDNIVLSFYTLKGVFRYKYEIPLVDTGKEGVKFRLVRESGGKRGAVPDKKGRLEAGEIFDKILNVKDFFNENKSLICDLKDYLRDRLLLVEFNLKISEGTGNAYNTAIISGILWSLAGILTSYLSKTIRMMKKCVSILPCFNYEVFSVDFICIFHARLVHIIVVLMKIYINRHKNLKRNVKETGGGFNGRTASN